MEPMEDVLDLPKETPFNFSESLSLQNLASTKVALCLLRYKICFTTIENNVNRSWSWYYDYHPLLKSWDDFLEFSCREVIVVSTDIGDIIDKRIVLIGNELRIWLKRLVMFPATFWYEKSWSENGCKMFLTLFDNNVFKQDCTICLRSFAIQLLTFTEVPIFKYRIACEFCLENYVRELWPLVNNDVDQLGRFPLELYWNDVMMKKRNAESEENGLTCSIKNNVGYIWDKLSKTEQTLRAIKVLKSANFCVVKFLLPRLDEIQAERVCAEVGDLIFRAMVEKDEYFEYAMKSLIYMKNFIPEKVFCSIIRQLWLIVSSHFKSNLEIERCAALLEEIWITASDQLKAFVLNQDNFLEFATLDDEVQSIDVDSSKVLFVLLNNVNYELRNVVWQRHWRKFIVRAKPSKLEEILRFFIADEKEIEQFKEHKMAKFEELENYFSWWMKNGFFAEFSEYLNFCLKDSQRLENLSKEIILSNLNFILLCDENELGKVHSFIHSTFRDTQSATKFTNELLLAPECLGLIYYKLEESRFDEVMSIASRFPTYEKHLNEMKRGFLEYWNRNLARGQITGFVGQKFENFLSWCLNETTIFEFKLSLNIGNIFDIIVNKVIQEKLTSPTSQTLLDLNNFLEWYFGSSENAKIYKLAVLNDQYSKWAFRDDTNKKAIIKTILNE